MPISCHKWLTRLRTIWVQHIPVNCYGAEPPRERSLYPQARRSLIDYSRWQDRRLHRLGVPRLAPPRHRRKTLFSMATPGVLSLLHEHKLKSRSYGHRGALCCE